MKSDIVYSSDFLSINLEGNVTKRSYQKLKKKIDYIVNEYEINGIIIDIKNSDINQEYLDDFKESFNNIIIKR